MLQYQTSATKRLSKILSNKQPDKSNWNKSNWLENTSNTQTLNDAVKVVTLFSSNCRKRDLSDTKNKPSKMKNAFKTDVEMLLPIIICNRIQNNQ